MLRRIADLLVEPDDERLDRALAVLGEQAAVRSALWCPSGESLALLSRHPDGDPEPGDLAAAVESWADRLESPNVRTGSELAGAPKLSNDSTWQAVWPLDLGEHGRALWVVESASDPTGDRGAAADGGPEDDPEARPAPDPFGELEPVAQLLRLALQLRLTRARNRVEGQAQLRELREQRRLMEKIVDALPVGLYVVDRDYRIVAWNRKRETGTQGVAREDAIGRSVFEVLYRQPEDTLRDELQDVFESGEIRHYEVESTASGEPRYYRLTKVPMRLGEGNEPTHVITIGEDMTERKRMAEQIAHAEKLAALGQMVAGVMHEINNPLATITAGAEALREEVEDESESATLLSMIDAEVDRCKRIARDLLSFSRPPPSEKGPVDVQECVEETLKLLRHHERFKKIRVQREYVYDLPLVWADSERLVQVFVALALNALDAMEDDGELRVRTELLGDAEVAVSFIDNGCGIPASDLSKIFEPFYTSKPPGKGTGLGLSICYGIIQEHGGRIEVDSKLGLGSNFRVALPTNPSEDGDRDPSAGSAPAPEPSETGGEIE